MDNKEKQEEEEEDRFRDTFKYYKRRKPPPDLSRAIDVDSSSAEVEVQSLPAASEQDKTTAREAGLTPPHTWTVHSLVKHPGLLIVRNPFTRTGQLVWALRCLRDIPSAPNKTNLASHGIQLKDRTWWQLCRTKEGQRNGLRQMLRWVTLGYHHDWDTKEYSEDMRGDMPECVVQLCGVVVRVLGLCGGGGDGSSGGGEFKAQAAIINYYHHHSTLGPHNDHSEPYMDAPLLSFSFGQSAVFLIGGPTKATAPSAILLHSGDIVIMSGAARLCYHAVPRILQNGEWTRRRRRRRDGEEEMDAAEKGEEEEEKKEPWATELNKEDMKKWKMTKRKKGEEKKEEEEERWAIEINKEDKKEEWKMTKRTKNGEEEMEEEEENMEDKKEEENKHKNMEAGTEKQEKEEKEKDDKHKNTEPGMEKQDEPEEPSKRRKMEGEEEENENGNQKTAPQTTEKQQNDESERRMQQNGDQNKDDDGDGGDGDDLPDILQYLRTCRINMNIRQVLPPSMDTLPS